MRLNSHDTRKGNAWKFVKTLHVKFFPFGQKWPSRIVTVKVTGFTGAKWTLDTESWEERPVSILRMIFFAGHVF